MRAMSDEVWAPNSFLERDLSRQSVNLDGLCCLPIEGHLSLSEDGRYSGEFALSKYEDGSESCGMSLGEGFVFKP